MVDSEQVVCPHCAAINCLASDRKGDEPLCGACKKPLFTGLPLELTTANFDRHIGNSDQPFLVDFWAPWCAPCRMMSPVIESAAKELKDTMRVAKLNTETEGAIAARYGIRSIPTLIVIRAGRVVQQRSGATDLKTLLDWARSAVDCCA